MKVSQISSPDPLTIPPQCKLARAVELMAANELRHLPVVDGKDLVGILSERDVLEATGWEPERYIDPETRSAKTARDYMGVRIQAVSPDEDIEVAAGSLRDGGIGCLPVLENGRLVGLVTETDVMKAFVRRCEDRGDDEAFDPPLWDRMSRDVVSIGPEALLSEALVKLRAEGLRHLPVLHDGWFVGMLSDRDVRLRAGRGELDTRRVDEVMSTELVKLGPGSKLSEAARSMLAHRLSSVAVTEEERLIGLVTSADVLDHCRGIDWGSAPG